MITLEPIKVSIKLQAGAHIPTRGSDFAAGYDLYAYIEDKVEIPPGGMLKIDTGVSMTPPPGYFGAIFPRSGLSTKQGLRLANCVGVCDEDYTGEYIVPIYNDSDETQYIYPDTRIAQLVFLPYLSIDFQEVDNLEKTDRGAGGFGSTGTN